MQEEQERWALSNAQLSTFGTHELSASLYELLCGLQGAHGVADPALLGTFLDAPAAYSSTGRQAFRRQFQKAIKSAAQTADRDVQVPPPLPVARMLLVEEGDPPNLPSGEEEAAETGAWAAVEELSRQAPKEGSDATAICRIRSGSQRLDRN